MKTILVAILLSINTAFASNLFDDIGEGDFEYKSYMASQRVMIDYISAHPVLDTSIDSAVHIADGIPNEYMDDVGVTRELIKIYGSALKKIGMTEDQRNTNLMRTSKLIRTYVQCVNEATLKSIHDSKNAGTENESGI
jgi:hypothetical protein